MRDTPFVAIFMVFYNEDFEKDMILKSNTSVLKIIGWYDRDSKCFEIGHKRIQIILQDVALTFSLPIEEDEFIMNKTYTLKDRDFVKHYFRNNEEYHKNLNWRRIEWSFGRKKRTELDLTKDIAAGAAMTPNKVIKDKKGLQPKTLQL